MLFKKGTISNDSLFIISNNTLNNLRIICCYFYGMLNYFFFKFFISFFVNVIFIRD